MAWRALQSSFFSIADSQAAASSLLTKLRKVIRVRRFCCAARAADFCRLLNREMDNSASARLPAARLWPQTGSVYPQKPLRFRSLMIAQSMSALTPSRFPILATRGSLPGSRNCVTRPRFTARLSLRLSRLSPPEVCRTGLATRVTRPWFTARFSQLRVRSPNLAAIVSAPPSPPEVRRPRLVTMSVRLTPEFPVRECEPQRKHALPAAQIQSDPARQQRIHPASTPTLARNDGHCALRPLFDLQPAPSTCNSQNQASCFSKTKFESTRLES